MSEDKIRLMEEYEGQRRVGFHCPGCGCAHFVKVPSWEWNKSMDKPTFRPSIKVTGGTSGIVCHSFVTDGLIQYLGDCTHALAGQTVGVPVWDDAP